MGKLKETNKNIIDPNEIPVRDELVMRLILGATKSGIQVDRKKKENKESCRKYRSGDE